jgi:hypothetical protein
MITISIRRKDERIIGCEIGIGDRHWHIYLSGPNIRIIRIFGNDNRVIAFIPLGISTFSSESSPTEDTFRMEYGHRNQYKDAILVEQNVLDESKPIWRPTPPADDAFRI